MKIEDFDFHTELSDGDKCHHLKAWYENFHTCHQKMLSDGDGLIGITIEVCHEKGEHLQSTSCSNLPTISIHIISMIYNEI